MSKTYLGLVVAASKWSPLGWVPDSWRRPKESRPIDRTVLIQVRDELTRLVDIIDDELEDTTENSDGTG